MWLSSSLLGRVGVGVRPLRGFRRHAQWIGVPMAKERWLSAWAATSEPLGDGSRPEVSSAELFRGFDVGEVNSLAGNGVGSRTGAPLDSSEHIHTGFWTEADGGTTPSPSAGSGRYQPPEVPGYEILGVLGRGGMGVVYQARQLRLNRLVALKMILAGDHAGPEALERLLAEAETIAQIKHPNIVQIHAIGDCGGLPYVELEFVEGGSLGARLDGTPWSPRSAARLVECVARAASEAHRLGIVHRDLKPANILLTAGGEPKISDFGLAKCLEKESGLTRTESVLGSPSYMAPEQADGRAKDVGPAADIYALGATLYELITGRRPFVAPTILATLDLVKNSEPVPPRRLQPHLPRDLETICLKCLEKEPQQRYPSAEALAEDLEAFLNDDPIRIRPPRPWERAVRWVRRRPAVAALALVCTLAVVSSAGLRAWYEASAVAQAAAARRRDDALRAQADRFVAVGREAVGRGDWEAASVQVGSALALIRSEPHLAALRKAAEGLLALSNREIADEKARESDRERFANFLQLYDEAVFYQSDYTGMDAEANLRAGRASARRALAQFRPATHDRGDHGHGLDLDPAHFSAREVERIVDGCYELAILLAEAESQPLPGEDDDQQTREALRVLDGARRLRPTTPAYHLRRAGYLERLGDGAGAEAQRRLAGSASVSGSGGSSIDDFLAGQQAYRRGDLKAASVALQKALSLQPDNFWAQYLLAVCHLRAHRPVEAQAALIACQSRRPRFVWSYLLKGFAEGEMGEFDLAEADFRRAAEIGLSDQERYVMLVNRGVLRVRRGKEPEAIDDLTEAIDLKPDHFQAYVNLAQAYQNLERWDDAMATLARAIARAPGQAVLFRARSRVHRQRSRPEPALDDLARAIAASAPDDPALADDHLERALILRQAGRSVEALADCDRAIALGPDRSDAQRLRGVILVELKRYDEAIRSFDACLARGLAPQAIYEARGLARAWSGSYERAIADYTMALNVGRGGPSLYAYRGWSYLLSGAPAPALRDFDAALRLDPSNGHAMSGRAQAYVQLMRPGEAVVDARGCVRLDPGDARQAYNAARVLCQAAVCLEADPARFGGGWAASGRYRAEALEYLARARELHPEADRARFWDEVVRADVTIEPIRRSRRYRELDALAGRPARPHPPQKVTGL